eukprot:815477-Rhodomonas_salina.1
MALSLLAGRSHADSVMVRESCSVDSSRGQLHLSEALDGSDELLREDFSNCVVVLSLPAILCCQSSCSHTLVCSRTAQATRARGQCDAFTDAFCSLSCARKMHPRRGTSNAAYSKWTE